MRIAITSDTHYREENRQILAGFWESLSRENFDVLVHAGDWISNNQDQFGPAMEQVRAFMPDIPVLTVKGNHDYWNLELGADPDQMSATHNELFIQNNIINLENGPAEVGGLKFSGFMGWYCRVNTLTNDYDRIPGGRHYLFDYFSRLHRGGMEAAIDSKSDVCVTHFPAFTESLLYEELCAPLRFMEYLTTNFRLLVVGHSHRAADFVENGCRVINAGGDYDRPQYAVVEV